MPDSVAEFGGVPRGAPDVSAAGVTWAAGAEGVPEFPAATVAAAVGVAGAAGTGGVPGVSATT